MISVPSNLISDVRILLGGFGSHVILPLKLRELALGFVVIDEHNIILYTPQVWTIFRSVSIQEIRIRNLADHVRDFWAHSMLLAKRLVGISLQDETLEEGSIEIQSVALLDRETVVVDLWTQLPSLAVSIGKA